MKKVLAHSVNELRQRYEDGYDICFNNKIYYKVVGTLTAHWIQDAPPKGKGLTYFIRRFENFKERPCAPYFEEAVKPYWYYVDEKGGNGKNPIDTRSRT
jgi:hypothetical protein